MTKTVSIEPPSRLDMKTKARVFFFLFSLSRRWNDVSGDASSAFPCRQVQQPACSGPRSWPHASPRSSAGLASLGPSAGSTGKANCPAVPSQSQVSFQQDTTTHGRREFETGLCHYGCKETDRSRCRMSIPVIFSSAYYPSIFLLDSWTISSISWTISLHLSEACLAKIAQIKL